MAASSCEGPRPNPRSRRHNRSADQPVHEFSKTCASTTTFRPSRTYCSVSGGSSRNSKYASSKTTTMFLGTRDMKLSMARCEIKVPRGIVWIRNENQARFRRDCIQRRAEVLLKIRSRQFDRARSERGREQFIDNKRILKNNYVIGRIQKCVTEKFDHLI